MKTRLLHTKIYLDSYVLSLPPKIKFFFIFLITNENVGMTAYYEISPQLLSFCTGFTPKEIEDIKNKLSKDGKFIFYKEWVFICNYDKYQSYKGEKNDTAYNKEFSLVPENIKKYCIDRVSEYPDTPINNKQEIINNKSETIKGGSGGVKILDDEKFVKELITLFPNKDIPHEIEKMKDWLKANGKTKKDYPAFARNWIRSDLAKGKIDRETEVIKI